MHIAIDLDEVLSETLEGVLLHHNYNYFGKKISKELFSTYNAFELEGYHNDIDYAIRRFHDYIDQYSHLAGIVKHSQKKMQQRKNEGKKISIITARKEKSKIRTEEFIQKNFQGLVDEIHFANHFSDKSRKKSEICHHIEAEVMIEDNLEYAQELAENGIPTFLLDKPRNAHYHPDKHHDDITKVLTWEEITIK